MASPGLAYWRAAVEGSTAMDVEAAACMTALPGFADACRTAIRQTLARHARSMRVPHAAEDMSSFIYGFLVLYLDTLGGVTLTRLQQICTQLNIASPGRAQAILRRLRKIGYVQPDPNPENRRDRPYISSPEMLTSLREALTDELRAFVLIEPEAAGIDRRMMEPEFFRTFVLRFGFALMNGLRRLDRKDAIQLFSERNAGLIILFDILASAAPGDTYPPRSEVKISVNGLAKKFAVSRSHVSRLLQDAEAHGFIKRHREDGTAILCETLRSDVTRFHFFIFAGLALCAHHALEIEQANAS